MMKSKLLATVLCTFGMISVGYAAAKITAQKAEYMYGFQGEGEIAKEGNINKLNSIYLDISPNTYYTLYCKVKTYPTSDEKVPISIMWKNMDENNMVYYVNYVHVTPKTDNGKNIINLLASDYYNSFIIENVKATSYGSSLNFNLDTTKNGLSYYCYSLKD